MLQNIFGSRIRAKLLEWFFSNTEDSFFVRQISSILGEDPTNLSREMSRLETAGILVSHRKGNLKLFKADPKGPFFYELKGLALKNLELLNNQSAKS